MSHLVAYIGNEPEHMECALYPARSALHVHPDHRPLDGWRLGFVQGGDVLLQKKPRADASDLDFFALAKDLRADAFVGRVDGSGDHESECQDPFRFRWWLGAVICRLADQVQTRSRLVEAIPSFLRRNIHGASAGEHLFHLFLAKMHEAGALELPAPAPQIAHRAARDALRLLQGPSAATPSAEPPAAQVALVVSNGRTLVAAAQGVPTRFLSVRGLNDCPVCHSHRNASGNGRRISHDGLRAVIVESSPKSGERAGWQLVPPGQVLVVGPDRTPALLPL